MVVMLAGGGYLRLRVLRRLCRSVSYIQGQSPAPKTREYFYYIDHQGQLFLDDTKVKNFITCFKDKKFLAFFFKRLGVNTGKYKDDFPYVSPCGKEMNYIRCDDLPVVFTHLLTPQGEIIEDIASYASSPPPGPLGVGSHAPDLLSFGGTGDLLTTPFLPNKLCMLPESGRVYHEAPDNKGGVGLIKSSLAIELSRYFWYGEGDNPEVAPPMGFRWRGGVYQLDNATLSSLKRPQ